MAHRIASVAATLFSLPLFSLPVLSQSQLFEEPDSAGKGVHEGDTKPAEGEDKV